MNSTQTATRPLDIRPATFDQAVVAHYRSHYDAEAAVRLLANSGLPVNHISIIGRHFETREDVQGFYRPADAALVGAGSGAWFGGIFGMMAGAMGFFIFPVVGALMVLGPLSGMIAGAIGGAGIGALVNGLIATGVPKDQALKYQDRLQAGEFLVIVHGGTHETSQAYEILHEHTPIHLQPQNTSTVGSENSTMAGVKM